MCIRKSLFFPMKQAGARPESLRLIPHGIDLSPFRNPQLLPQIDLPENRKIVFFAGRLSRGNYVDDVIEVGRVLAGRGDTVLLVAGGGPEEERLRAAVECKLEVRSVIRFLGFIQRDDVLALRMAATVNLAPMGGYSLIEACASGRPTVAYDVEWHSELIEDGVSGCLVAERDVVALVKAVETLLNDSTRAAAIGIAGRERAFELYDIENVFRVRAAVYQELLEEAF
jgi:glycosyltransferase involved in cell wall biosynthesis